MPSINVAMERSLRAGFVDLLAASLRPVLGQRGVVADVQGQITDVRTAFSSWDNCMQASFCKWPVIAIIIVAGLFVISIVWCMARCLCCGLSCCCECCYCLKCCGECCGMCTPPNKRHKHLDDPYSAPSQGYRTQAPMTAGFPKPAYTSPTYAQPALATAAAAHPPQYAEFDVSKKGGEHEDALPEMPSWDSAAKKKVLVEDDEVEMKDLKKPDANGQNVPLMAGAAGAPGPASPSPSPDPRGPYAQPQFGASSVYSGPSPANNDPYALGDEPYGEPGMHSQQSQSSLGVNHQAYGMAGAAGQGRRSPRAQGSPYGQMNQGYPGDRSPQDPYGDYSRSRQGSYDQYGMSGGVSPSRRSPPQSLNMPGGAYPPDRQRRSPGPQGDYGYGGGHGMPQQPQQPQYPPQPQRQYSSDSQRPLRAPPSRQYQHDAPPVSPIRNNSGFDFNSGYSRPQTAEAEHDPYARRPQQQQQPAGNNYPGYRPYQGNNQQQGGWGGM